MTLKVNKSGFTLIEIIVVLIIIGILAGIALPNMFSNVQKSGAYSAITAMDSIKSQLEKCAYENNINPLNSNACAPANFGLNTDQNGWHYSIATTNQPQNAAAGTWVASSGSPSAGTLTYSIFVTSPGTTPFYIALTRNPNGTFTCSAPQTGVYAGIC